MTATPEPPAVADPRGQPAFLRWIAVAEHLVGGLLVVVILVLVLVQVAQRFLPGGGWVWTGELATLSLMWLTFAVAGALTGADGHVALQLIDNVTAGRARHAVRLLASLAVAAVAAGFAYEAYSLVSSGTPQTTPAMGIPLTWVYVIPLAGFALTALHAVLGVGLTALRGLLGREPGGPAATEPGAEDDTPGRPRS
jgi:TRAP-type C4-dicarboxylate transport system permease small subunit